MVGVQLAIGVGGLMALVTIALVGYWIWTAPSQMPLANLSDPEKVRQVIDLEKQLRDSHVSAVMQVFDTVVIKCFLPLFTSILGYIFGSQSVRRSRD